MFGFSCRRHGTSAARQRSWVIAGSLSKDSAEQQWFNSPPKADSAFDLDNGHTAVVLTS
jgi:hypothetical protein